MSERETGWFAIPLAAIVGAPFYLNGYATIPLISGLIGIGMTPVQALPCHFSKHIRPLNVSFT